MTPRDHRSRAMKADDEHRGEVFENSSWRIRSKSIAALHPVKLGRVEGQGLPVQRDDAADRAEFR